MPWQGNVIGLGNIRNHTDVSVSFTEVTTSTIKVYSPLEEDYEDGESAFLLTRDGDVSRPLTVYGEMEYDFGPGTVPLKIKGTAGFTSGESQCEWTFDVSELNHFQDLTLTLHVVSDPNNAGAYEIDREQVATPLVFPGNEIGTEYLVTSLADNTNTDGKITLREAIEAANGTSPVGDAPAGSNIVDVIRFDESLFVGGPAKIELNGTQLSAILGYMRIIGPGADLLTIDGKNQSRVLYAGNTRLDVSGITIANGETPAGASNGYGAGILVAGQNARLRLDDVTVTGTENGTFGYGGAIQIYDAKRVEIRNSRIVDNPWAMGSGAVDANSSNNLLDGSVLWGSMEDALVDGVNGNMAGRELGWAAEPSVGGDGLWGTDDDVPPRLASYSLAIDGGQSSLLPVDTHDVDGDGNTAETIPRGWMGNPRQLGSAVDIGAEEFDSPWARIDAILPEGEITSDATVSFSATTGAPHGPATAFEWTSDRDCALSDQEDFELAASSLSGGTHTISFRAFDFTGKASDWATRTIEIASTLPELSIGDAGQLEGNSGTADLTFTVSLSAEADQDVTVSYSTSDQTATAGQDYTAAGGTLTIPQGELSATVTVAVIGDTEFESNETFGVTLSGASGATILQATATGTIENDDAAPTPVEGWNYRHSDLAGTNYHPDGSRVATSNRLELETTLGTADGFSLTGDIDGDEKCEFTVGWVTVHNGHGANGTTDGELYLTVTDDDGSNLLTQVYPSPDNGSAYHVFSDFNGDGTQEILAIERHDPTYYQGTSQVHLYDLAGNILHTYSGPENERWLWATADVNNDGQQNVVVGGPTVLALLNDQLEEVRSISEDGVVQLAADLTGDGYAEIVTVNSGNLLRVYDHQLDLIDSLQLPGDARTGLAVASDIDHDGVVELIVRSSVGSHVVAFSSEVTPLPVLSAGFVALESLDLSGGSLYYQVETSNDGILTQGGFNKAKLHDTLGDDLLQVTPDWVQLSVQRDELDMLYRAMAFEWVKAYGSEGHDTVQKPDVVDFVQLALDGPWVE